MSEQERIDAANALFELHNRLNVLIGNAALKVRAVEAVSDTVRELGREIIVETEAAVEQIVGR